MTPEFRQTDLAAQWDKLVNKFRACVDPVLGNEKTEKIIDKVKHLDKVDDISELAALWS